MRTVDFTPLYRSIVGFDRLADMMDSATKIESQGYPPTTSSTWTKTSI